MSSIQRCLCLIGSACAVALILILTARTPLPDRPSDSGAAPADAAKRPQSDRLGSGAQGSPDLIQRLTRMQQAAEARPDQDPVAKVKQLAALREEMSQQLLRTFEENPAEKIPELTLLTPADLAQLAASLTGSEPSGELFALVRTEAKKKMGDAFSRALYSYLNANQHLPGSLDEIASLLPANVDPRVIDRYVMPRPGGEEGHEVSYDAPLILERLDGIGAYDTMHWAGVLAKGVMKPVGAAAPGSETKL